MFDKCKRYGVIIERKKKCCGCVFVDDIVLLNPKKSSLNKVHDWGVKNEIIFGISYCPTLVAKLKNLISSVFINIHILEYLSMIIEFRVYYCLYEQ
jgi:hypothetical protein